MNTGIYAIENTVNGKMYVGSAADLKKRGSQHFAQLRDSVHHSRKLQRSYNKHGKEIFEFRTLLVCRKEDLLFYEQLAIDKFSAVKGGYNIAPIAGSPTGVKRTPEAKANYSAASKAKWADPEFRTRQSAASKTVQADPEYRAKISAARKATWADPEYRAKMKIAQADPEYRAKISAVRKAAMADPEFRARQSATMKAYYAAKREAA